MSLSTDHRPRRANAYLFRILTTIAFLFAAALVAFYNFDWAAFCSSIARFDLATIGYVLAITAIGYALASLRLRVIASDLGYDLSFKQSIATVSLGLVGGFLFFQLVGQLVARGAYLAKRSIPMSGTVIITGSERIGAAIVSAAMAAAGAIYIFGKLSVDTTLLPVRLLTGLVFVLAACALLWRAELVSIFRSITSNMMWRALRSVALSGVVQITTMASYVVAAHTIAPNVPIVSLAAAAAIVMFAASIPISIAGWGVRELSAVAALSLVGVPKDGALIVAVLIGAASILLATILAVLTGADRTTAETPSVRPSTVKADHYETPIIFVLVIAVAALVFFQVHLPTTRGTINANLADPLVILGGLIFAFSLRHGAPVWRLAGLSTYILACTVIITVALFIGAHAIGWTQWALTNKYLGWFVLLAYGATGYLSQRIGFERVVETFVTAGAAIILIEIAELIYGSFSGVPPQHHFSGFAENPNSFAFQCLMMLCISLTLKQYGMFFVATSLVGLWLSGSRTGMMSAIFVLVASALYQRSAWKMVAGALIIAALGVVGIMSMHLISGQDCTRYFSAVCGISNLISGQRLHSVTQHVDLLASGWSMFTDHPIFGAGLGVFIDQWTGPQKLVIHSTPLWLLAELGIVGFLAFMIPAIRMAWSEMRRYGHNDQAGTFILLALVAFGSMSMLHELLYQRSLWFLLGAALATKPPVPRSSEQSH